MKTYQASRANPDLDFFCCGGMDMNGSKKKKTHVFNPWSIFRLIFTNVLISEQIKQNHLRRFLDNTALCQWN